MSYQKWTAEEDNLLINYLRKGLSTIECAKLLERPYDSLQKRVKFIYNDLHWNFLLLADTHIPFSINLRPLYDFIDDFKPKIVAHLGDIIDPSPLSPWNRNKRNNVFASIDRSLKKDLIETRIYLKKTGKYAERQIYIPGNHEGWINLFTDEIPYLKDYLGKMRELLQLGDDFEIIEPDDKRDNKKAYAEIGKLKLIHGWYCNRYHAAKTVEVAESNIVYGHVHDSQEFTKVNLLDSDPHIASSIPCLCNLNPEYIRDKPNKWVNGFGWGAVNRITGYFNLYKTIILPDGSFWCNKFYK